MSVELDAHERKAHQELGRHDSDGAVEHCEAEENTPVPPSRIEVDPKLRIELVPDSKLRSEISSRHSLSKGRRTWQYWHAEVTLPSAR